MSTIRNTERALRDVADEAKAGAETLSHEARAVAHDARKGAEKLAEKASETLSETWKDAKSYADETLANAGDKAAAAKDQAVDFATDMQRQLTRMIEERPLASLAIGVGLAFALGALWKTSTPRQPAWYEMDRWRR